MPLIADYHNFVRFYCFPCDCCSITVRLLFIILIPRNVSRYFDPQIGQHHLKPQVSKHQKVQDLPTSVIA
jgi:hypothetical protein